MKPEDKTSILIGSFGILILTAIILIVFWSLYWNHVETNPEISKLLQPTKNFTIPEWVRSVAGWWSEKEISDQDYFNSIEYLLNHGIIKITNSSGFP